ncbi:Hypothetical protein A7982_02152 [Minicystis rosea]|nr:Hypothetical protein A7982_02152 [Minicystis rosea]
MSAPCRICGWSVDIEGDLCSTCLKRERERLDRAAEREARRRAVPEFEPPGPRWKNPEPLWILLPTMAGSDVPGLWSESITGDYVVGDLDRSTFPEVLDLEIGHHGLLDESYVYFASPTLGWLGGFAWWSTFGQSLVTEGMRAVPRGSMEHPWNDLEQGWEMLLWEHDGYVYVAEGGEVTSRARRSLDGTRRSFHCWFRVPLPLYLERFEALIERLRRDAQP